MAHQPTCASWRELPESWKTEPGLQDPTPEAVAYSRPLDQDELPAVLKHELSVDGMMAMGWNHYRYSLQKIFLLPPFAWRVALGFFLSEYERTACQLGWAQTIENAGNRCETLKYNDQGRSLYTLCWYVDGICAAYDLFHDIETILKLWRAGEFTLERAHSHIAVSGEHDDDMPCDWCRKLIGPCGMALEGLLTTGFYVCSGDCAAKVTNREFRNHAEFFRLYGSSPEQYDHPLCNPNTGGGIKDWLFSLPREPYIRRATWTTVACSFCGHELQTNFYGEAIQKGCGYCGCRKWWIAKLPLPTTTMVVAPRFKPKIKRRSE